MTAKVLKEFTGLVENVEDGTAYLELTSCLNGEVLHGEYSAEKLESLGIREGDLFHCRTIEFDKDSVKIEFEPIHEIKPMKIVLASEQDSIEVVDGFGKELATIKKTEITIHDPSMQCKSRSTVQPMELRELQGKSYYLCCELSIFTQNIFLEEKTFQVYYTSGKLHFQEVELIPKNCCPVLICGQLCEKEEGHAGGHHASL